MKRNDTQNYNYLIGMTKQEILKELGDDFNYYPNQLWHYVMKKNWWGKKWILYIKFDNQDKVISEYIISRYGKVRTSVEYNTR